MINERKPYADNDATIRRPPPGGFIIVGVLLFGAGPSWGGFPKPSNSLVLSTRIVLAKMSFGFGNPLLIIPPQPVSFIELLHRPKYLEETLTSK